MNRVLNDFQSKQLQKALKNQSLSLRNKLRIEIMLHFDAGKTQKEICKTLHCSPATARQWIQVAKGGQAHRWQDFCADGRPPKVSVVYRERLLELVKYHSPKDFKFAFSKWTAKALQQQLMKEFDVEVSPRHINRVLNTAGLSSRDLASQENLSKARIKIEDLRWQDDKEAL
jgi:transposase